MGPEEIARLTAAYEQTSSAIDLGDRSDPLAKMIVKKILRLGNAVCESPTRFRVGNQGTCALKPCAECKANESTRLCRMLIFLLLRGSADSTALRNCWNRPAWMPEHPGNYNCRREGLVLGRDHPLAPFVRKTSVAMTSAASACLRTSTFARR